MKNVFGILALILCLQCAQAQSLEEKKNIFQRFATWRETRMMKGVDTTYITLPNKAWLVRANVNVSSINIAENFSNVSYIDYLNINMKSGVSWKPNISLAYRGLELSYGVDFAHRFNRDFRLQLHGKRIGGEFHYLTFHGAETTIESNLLQPNNSYLINDCPITAKRIAVNAYFVFNTKTFSYPAGIKQSYFQKKSSGSFIAGANFSHNDLHSDSISVGTPSIQEILSCNRRIKCNQIAIGAGYSYNFIFRNFPLLIHASVMPMLSYTFGAHIYKNDVETTTNHSGSDKHPIGPSISARTAISYAINDNLLVSTSVNFNYFWSDLADQYAFSTYNIAGLAYIAYRF